VLRLVPLLLLAACATTPPAQTSTGTASPPPDLDARLERIATRAVDTVTHGGPVPQLAPTSLDPLPANLEVVTFASHDGLALRAWLVEPTSPAKGTIVVLPGWSSAVEFALDQTHFLAEGGYRLLLLDPRANLFRGHPQDYRGYLDEDLRDIDAGLKWLEARPGVDVKRVVVLGFSWGGMKALLTSGRHPQLRAVIDDAGSVAESPFLKHFYEFAPPAVRGDAAVKARYLALVDAKLKASMGCQLGQFDVFAAAAALAPRPLLVIHSEDDGFVPIAVSERVMAAAHEPKTFVRATDFGHGLGMRRNPGAYNPAVFSFLEAVLK
jgi:dienelactone hydrolase